MFTGMDRNDPFAAIDTADATGQRNPYLLQGQYHLRVESAKMIESRQGKLFYLVELTILSSDNLDRPAGLVVSWMTNMRLDMGPINVKRFLAAVNGIDPDSQQANTDINAEVAKFSVDDSQPLKGLEVAAQCSDIITRDKKPFLDVKWIPLQQ